MCLRVRGRHARDSDPSRWCSSVTENANFNGIWTCWLCDPLERPSNRPTISLAASFTSRLLLVKMTFKLFSRPTFIYRYLSSIEFFHRVFCMQRRRWRENADAKNKVCRKHRILWRSFMIFNLISPYLIYRCESIRFFMMMMMMG